MSGTRAARTRAVAAAFAVAGLATAARPLEATKPCPPSPCVNEKQAFDAAACAAASTWIAVGRIEDVKHDVQGPPLSKDFATFTLRVTSWEKGGAADVKTLRFKVEWCRNQQPPPAETSGTFRFYGRGRPGDGAAPPEYLWIERAAAAK